MAIRFPSQPLPQCPYPEQTARRPGLRFRHKLALWFSGVMLFCTFLAVFLTYQMSARILIQEFGTNLETVATDAASEIDVDAFMRLSRPDQMRSPGYRSILASLLRARVRAKRRIPIRYLYTMVPTQEPSIWRFVVDTQPPILPGGFPNKDFSALGDTEDFTHGDIILDTYRTGVPHVDSDVKYYPGWSDLLSAAAPIRDRDGHVVGIVGVDAPAKAVGKLRKQLGQIVVVCLVIGFLAAVGGSAIVAWQLSRPISTLVAATEAVGGGNLQTTVMIPGSDELAQLGEAFNQMTVGLHQRELYKRQFERYVSHQIAAKILQDPERVFWQGERRRATILFSDIRDFTTMSERLPPEDVVSRLNEYLEAMIDIVFAHEGTLDKFVGDSIMAVFGAPVSLGDDEERAVRVALDMQEATIRLSKSWTARGLPPLRIGIGIHSGDVVVGNIGSEQRLEYAAIGDTVNFASRLESLNKTYGSTILISETTYQAVWPLIEARRLDAVRVRGREQPVPIYELLHLRNLH
jgi:adenylate cyclase